MNIWIENKVGRLEGYSLMDQPEMVKLEVEKEPTDFSNWIYDGTDLVFDEQEVAEYEPTEIEKLGQQVTDLEIENALKEQAVESLGQSVTDLEIEFAILKGEITHE